MECQHYSRYVDTGADVSAISESIFKQLKDVPIVQSDRHLGGPSQYQIHVQVSGKFTATMKLALRNQKKTFS